MLRQMTSIFGNDWWDFMVIGVSKWSYKQTEIDARNETCTYYPDMCQDEAWFIREFNAQFQEKFHLTKNFTFAFVDSWSQKKPDIDDPIQQQHWKEETEKLWEAATTNNKTFVFMTIDDVLEENSACKEENLRLHDIIDEEIENLKDDLSAVASSVAINSNNIDNNSDEISLVSTTLTESINGVSQQVDGNKAAIDEMEVESK